MVACLNAAAVRFIQTIRVQNLILQNWCSLRDAAPTIISWLHFGTLLVCSVLPLFKFIQRVAQFWKVTCSSTFSVREFDLFDDRLVALLWKKPIRSNMHNFNILAKHKMEKNEVENLKLHSITTVCSNNIRAKSKDAILSEINQISSYQALFRPKSLQWRLISKNMQEC